METVRRVFKSRRVQKVLRSRQLKILLATILVLLAVSVVRAVSLCASYPEVDVPIEELFGENSDNLTHLNVDGHKLTATSNSTKIYYELGEPIAVHAVRFDVSTLSRENCRSYIDLVDADSLNRFTESSVLMAKGRNYITFEESSSSDRVAALDMLPVTLRAVNFTYDAYIINPHERFIFTSLRTGAFLMLAAVMLELVCFFAAFSYRRNERKRTSLPIAVLICALQAAHAGIFIYLYFTGEWEPYTMAYFFILYLCTSLFLLNILRPDRSLTIFYRTGKRQHPTHTEVDYRRELPILRIALLSVINFCCTEVLYSDQFKLDKPIAIFGNLLIYALPYILLWCVLPGKRYRWLTYAIPEIFWLVIGGINHYYFEYRSQAFEYSDLTMASTFRNVAGSYKLDLVPELFLVYVTCALILLSLMFENRRIYRSRTWKSIVPGIAVIVFALLWLPSNIPYVSLWNTNTATKHNGYALSFLSYAEKSLEKPVPDGYSADETKAMLETYRDDAAEDDGAVNVIVMMNEAFSDLPATYGFDTDVDNLPYIHSLSGANVKKGRLLVSVFGGTTADTEYEFLTGNSLSFLNGEAVPYTQYINSPQQSLADLLKARGYSATAFHPYLASGYKRYKVYPLLGFDQFLASDTADLPYMSRLRSYVSDEADVEDVIDIYEHREKYGIESGKGPFFLFNVTMQNHGGYNASVSAVDVTVNPTDPELSQYSELQEYLSLARATDDAFRSLTEYFAGVDEKTIILMFGDHQPSMDEYVYRALEPDMYAESASIEEKDKKYTVPYTMWANYDLPEGELPLTSPNFLRAFLLENAGLRLSAYDSFNAKVREAFPAMNRLGFVDANGAYHDVSEIDGNETLMDYKKAAYYNLFDHHKMDQTLFR